MPRGSLILLIQTEKVISGLDVSSQWHCLIINYSYLEVIQTEYF